MIAIRQLLKFDHDELKRVMPGYTSHECYDVHFTESADGSHINFELSLVGLERPFVKSWLDDHDEETLVSYAQYVSSGLSRGVFDGEVLVALAIAEAQDWNRTLWIWEFGVAESHRGRGIGQRLMQAMVEVARQGGLRAVGLETQTSNVPAIRFYRRAGFAFDGIRLSLYSNEDVERGEVALFMRRQLEYLG
jgi:ribosomal protein S18 acetylase RimI-like enzyme